MDETNEVDEAVMEGPGDDNEKFGGIIQEIVERRSVLPFGNSMFAEIALVAGEHPTPARIAHQMLNQAMTRVEALRNSFYEKRRNDIKLEVMRRTLEKIKNWEKYTYHDTTGIPELDAELINLDIERILVDRNYEKGIIRDQLASLAFLYENIKKMPKYTRAQFEAEEEQYYAKKLSNQIAANPQDPGARMSLNMILNQSSKMALLASGIRAEDHLEFAKKLDIESLEKTLLPILKNNQLLKDGRNDD